MRLILSRKGFDSAAGGVASPILPDGRLCPLPIPDDRSPYRYEDLTVAGVPMAQLIADLRPKRLPPITRAHLDPDLDAASMGRPAGWRPMFGQAGAAQSHLLNQGVDVGDIFLFYGWFREVEQVNGRFSYKADSPDRHVIYGWLQVGQRWPVVLPSGQNKDVPDWVKSQVHFKRQGMEQGNDMVYVSAERLALPGARTSLAGGGLLKRYRPSLCLTAPSRSRSHWLLPGWFRPDGGKRPLSYHGDGKRWQKVGDNVLLRVVSRGQEFVLRSEDYPKIVTWVGEMLTGMIHSDD